MLILSRRPGDAILLDGGIRIVVIASDRGGVRLGIEAPPEIQIVRQELATQVADENRRATALAGAGPLLHAIKPTRRGTVSGD
jgi:carbon storage regulator